MAARAQTARARRRSFDRRDRDLPASPDRRRRYGVRPAGRRAQRRRTRHARHGFERFAVAAGGHPAHDRVRSSSPKPRRQIREPWSTSAFSLRICGGTLAASMTAAPLFGPNLNIMRFDYDFSFAGHRGRGAQSLARAGRGSFDPGLRPRGWRSAADRFRRQPGATYRTDDVAAHQQRFLRLLSRACGSRSCRSAASTFSPPDERHTILRTWNDTAPRPASANAHVAGAVRRTGRAHARCGRGGLRGAEPQLPRARRALEPARASSARARRRPRDHRRAVRRALARHGGRAPRHPQGRRRLPAARSRTTRRSASPSCWPTPACAVLVTQSALRRPPARAPRPADRRLDADRPLIARQPASRPARPHRSRTPPPTSSTPRARPDSPKASPSPIRTWLRLFDTPRTPVRFRHRSDVWTLVPFLRLRLLGLGDLGRAAARRPRWSSCPTATSRSPAAFSQLLVREARDRLNQTPVGCSIS